MLKIGLTGGIGTGKSSAARCFASFDIPIIDADVIAHQLCQPQQLGLQQIVAHFGTDLLNSEGLLNRDKLRALVFSQPAQKQQLESLLHPLIYAEIAAQLTQLKAVYCIVSIPLLIETQKNSLVDRILVVDCPLEMQIERVKQRSSLAESQIRAIINSQASPAQRLAVANDVLDNSKTPTYLAEQVKKLHNSYLLLSSA